MVPGGIYYIFIKIHCHSIVTYILRQFVKNSFNLGEIRSGKETQNKIEGDCENRHNDNKLRKETSVYLFITMKKRKEGTMHAVE